MSTNFSYQQLRRRQVDGEGTDEKRLSLDLCLARVMVPRYSQHCIMRNQATGCVYIQEGFQFLAEETMNGIPLRSVDHSPGLEAASMHSGYFAGNGTNLTNYQAVMVTSIVTGGLQQFWVPKGGSAQLLGSVPDFRLRYAEGAATKGLNIEAAAAPGGGAGAVPPTSKNVTQLFTDFINTSRFSAYNIQGRYTLDDYVIPKFAAKITNDKNVNEDTGGCLLSFNFTTLYQNALRYEYDNQFPKNNSSTTPKGSEIHRLNVLAHNEAGREAGSYMGTGGFEDKKVTENIKTVMTRVYFDEFPPDGSQLNDVQKKSLDSFNDALRFRSYEIARRMVDDQRMWKLTNPFLGNMQKIDPGTPPTIIYPNNFSVSGENKLYTDLVATLDSSVLHATTKVFDKNVIVVNQVSKKLELVTATNATYGSDGAAKPSAAPSFPLILPDYHVLGTFAPDTSGATPPAWISAPTTLLNRLYAFQPLGLMDSGDNNGELVTVQSVGQRFFRPFIFEWEPNAIIEFNDTTGLPENVTVMNVYPGKKDQDKFVESVFDRARYYSVVFVVVDDNKVQHYYAVTTYDYRAVPTLIQQFTSALRDGTMETMKSHHVGENDPRQSVHDDDPNSNQGASKNDMEEFVRKLSVGASPVTPTEDAKKEKALLAPEFPLFPGPKGEIVMVPELLDVDAETAKEMYSQFVSSGGAQYDPSLAKSWGFLAKQPLEWANFLAGKLIAGNGNTTFSTFVKVPDLVKCEEGPDPLPHSLRGISSAKTSLSVGVTMREVYTRDQNHAVVPLVHPGLLNVVGEVYKQGMFGVTTKLHTMTRAGALGDAIDDTKRTKTAQFMKSALPPDESWGIVLTTMNIVNNMLSEEQLVRVKIDTTSSRRNRLDSVIGYRRIAQRLLNSMPHLGKLERLEAYTAIEHDIFGKLMGVAQHRQDEVAQGVLQLGLGALRNYVAKQTGHDKASLDQAARAARQKMAVPPPRWQMDNFFIDGSNSNKDEIHLFIFKYNDKTIAPVIPTENILNVCLAPDRLDLNGTQGTTRFGKGGNNNPPTLTAADVADEDWRKAIMFLVADKLISKPAHAVGLDRATPTPTNDMTYGVGSTGFDPTSDTAVAVWAPILNDGWIFIRHTGTPAAGQIDGNKISGDLYDECRKSYEKTFEMFDKIESGEVCLPFKDVQDEFSFDSKKQYRVDANGNLLDAKKQANSTDYILKAESPYSVSMAQNVELSEAGSFPNKFVGINGAARRELAMVSNSRTYVYSKKTRAIKIDDLLMSLGENNSDVRNNLCHNKMQDGEGLGIVWMNTGHNTMTQTNLTTQMRQIFSAPSLEPLIQADSQNTTQNNIFFKLPGARLVPSIKSFSHHMQYWSTKLGNNATMEKIYGDYQASSFKYEQEDYNKNAGRFKSLFREDFNLTKDEMNKRASQVPLTLTTDNTGGQYRTRVISADHQITGGSTMDFKQNVTSRSDGSRVSTINKRLKELYGNNFGQEDFYS